MKKFLRTSAVASAMVAPVAAFAAIDDQGMQYISASEGLSGSLRVDILTDTNAEGEDVSTKGAAVRLFISGDVDLGGGLKSTYAYEARDDNGRGAGGLNTHFYEIGLAGAFGNFTVGQLGMVAPRMVPSASLAYERGPNREAFVADPGTNGIRYESPVINGFQFGVSGVVDGTAGETGGQDGSLDEFSLAVKYTLPVGLQLGAGYEHQETSVTAATYAAASGIAAGAVTVRVGSDDALVVTLPTAFNTAPLDGDAMNGFRAGARYGMDNWLVAYEYRGYTGFDATE